MQPYPTVQNYGTFQQPYPQPYPDRLVQLQNSYQQAINVPQIQSPAQANQGLLWVSGEVGAKSYLVAPNSTVLLMDSDSSKFYLKSADNAGMPSLRIFEYTEITNTTQNATQGLNLNEKTLDYKYVTRKEYEDLKSQYEEIMDKLNNIQNVSVEKPARKVKGATDGE